MSAAPTTPAEARASLPKTVFINGAMEETPTHSEVTDPSTGKSLGASGVASAEQIERAVASAAAAWTTWKDLSDATRADWLRKVSAELTKRKSRISTIEALHTGKPLREAEGDVDDAAAALIYCANLAESGSTRAIQPNAAALAGAGPYVGSIAYEPVGVVVGITPFNFPLMMAAWKVGPALAAGCTVIIKPSEYTPFSTVEFAAAAAAVGLPAGVFQVLTGDGAVGAALVTHRLTDKVSFTGSERTGARIMAACAPGIKRLTLELGGKSPALVFPDANLDTAAEWLIFGAFWNTGQICSATARVLVHESVAEALTARLVAGARRLRQGTSFAAGVEIGPSVCKMQFEKVQGFIAKTLAEGGGAKLECGGGRPAGAEFAEGFWTAPTIFSGVTPAHSIFREEIFGPVMSITTFKTEAEAIALANDSDYGLAAAVFSTDKGTCARCSRAIRAGIVWSNHAQPSPHAMSWGGFKKSGIGREMGPLALLPFLEQKSILEWDAASPIGWYEPPI